MVGTAVYHVASYFFMFDQNVEAENLPAEGRATAAPAARELSKAATRPCTWNSGRTTTIESESVILYTDRMLWTEEWRL